MRLEVQQLEARTQCSYQLLEEAAAQYQKTHHALKKLEKGPADALFFFSECWDAHSTDTAEIIEKKLAREARERKDLQTALENDVE
jgi:hypothetical protein